MKITAEIPPLTPEQMAAMFWEMDDDWQGRFFDELGQLALTTPTPFTGQIGSMFGLDVQLHGASRKCTPLGRDVMSRFRENGHHLLQP